MERRLAAILAADVVGYSRLMGEDESLSRPASFAVGVQLILTMLPQRGPDFIQNAIFSRDVSYLASTCATAASGQGSSPAEMGRIVAALSHGRLRAVPPG